MLQKNISASPIGFTRFHETDDGFVLQTYNDLTPVVEACKREAIEGDANRIKGPEHGIHAATIPQDLYIDWGIKKAFPYLFSSKRKNTFSTSWPSIPYSI